MKKWLLILAASALAVGLALGLAFPGIAENITGPAAFTLSAEGVETIEGGDLSARNDEALAGLLEKLQPALTEEGEYERAVALLNELRELLGEEEFETRLAELDTNAANGNLSLAFLEELVDENREPDNGGGDPPPVESDALPTESDALPVESDSLPVESDALPTESDSLPVESDALPVESDALPVESDALPSESDALPTESDTLPVESDSLPVESDAVPVESDSLPVESDSLPGDDDQEDGDEQDPNLAALLAADFTPAELEMLYGIMNSYGEEVSREEFYSYMVRQLPYGTHDQIMAGLLGTEEMDTMDLDDPSDPPADGNRIKVTVRCVDTIFVNPYEIYVDMDEYTEDDEVKAMGWTGSSILSSPGLITNRCGVAVDVEATVSVTTTGGLTLKPYSTRFNPDGSAQQATSERNAFLYLEMQAVNDEDFDGAQWTADTWTFADYARQDAAGDVTSTGAVLPGGEGKRVLNMVIPAPASADAATYAAFKVGGDCSRPASTKDWSTHRNDGEWGESQWVPTEKPGATVHITFKFSPRESYNVTFDAYTPDEYWCFPDTSVSVGGVDVTAGTTARPTDPFVFVVTENNEDNYIYEVGYTKNGKHVSLKPYVSGEHATEATVTVPANTFAAGESVKISIVIKNRY